MGRIEVISCDKCGEETEFPRVVTCKELGIKWDLCADCVESLRTWRIGRPEHHTHSLHVFNDKDIESVRKKGAEALEAWANGATADDLAQMIRDMLSNAKREVQVENGKPKTLLGITIS